MPLGFFFAELRGKALRRNARFSHRRHISNSGSPFFLPPFSFLCEKGVHQLSLIKSKKVGKHANSQEVKIEHLRLSASVGRRRPLGTEVKEADQVVGRNLRILREICKEKKKKSKHIPSPQKVF